MGGPLPDLSKALLHCSDDGRYRTNRRQMSARTLKNCAANDPTETFAEHCGKALDDGSGPYRSALPASLARVQ